MTYKNFKNRELVKAYFTMLKQQQRESIQKNNNSPSLPSQYVENRFLRERRESNIKHLERCLLISDNRK